jgi:hypothetical protein
LTISASDSQVRLYDADGTNQFAAFQSDNGIAKITSRNNTSHGQIAFQRYNGTTVTDSMRIDSSGNVGIGTTSPATFGVLAVKKDQTADTAISVSNAGSSSASTTMSFTLNESGTAQGWLRRYRDGTGNTEVGFSDALLFSGNVTGSKTERMRIDSSGNLLVGKTSANLTTTGVEIDPNGILIATKNAGTVAYFNRLTTDGTILDFRKDGSPVGSIGAVDGDIVIGTGACGIRFHDGTPAIQPRNSNGNANNDAIDIGLAGNRFKDLYLSGTAYVATSVGIGTTSPQRNLHIHGSGDGAIKISNSTLGSGSLDGADLTLNTSGEFYLTNRESGSTIFETGGSERVRIDSSGNVGIGTSSPYHPLHVDKGATGDIAHFEGQGTVHLRIGEASNVMYLNANNGSAEIAFQSNGSEKMRIDSSGNLTATGNVTAFSDERLKDNIETLQGSKVLDMRGVSYTKDGEVSSGVIAQEIEKVAPELVHTAKDEMGTKSVAYGNLVGYLIEAIKDQQKQINDLKERLDNGTS